MPWSRLSYINRSRPARNKHHWCQFSTRKQHSSLHPHLHFGALTPWVFSGPSTSSQRKYFSKSFYNLINALYSTFSKLVSWEFEQTIKMLNTCTDYIYFFTYRSQSHPLITQNPSHSHWPLTQGRYTILQEWSNFLVKVWQGGLEPWLYENPLEHLMKGSRNTSKLHLVYVTTRWHQDTRQL